MANLALYIGIMIIIAAIAIGISVIAYNRHLDKVTRGEVHDTHSMVPEPRSTTGIVYKIILMVIVVLIYFSVGTMSGNISNMNHRINQLENDVRTLTYKVEDLTYELEQKDRLVSGFEYEVSDPVDSIVNVDFKLWVREYTDDTTVTMDIAGRNIALEGNGNGMFYCNFPVSIFEDCSLPMVSITGNGKTVGETIEFPDYLFWDYIPFPSLTCQFETKPGLTGMKTTGSYSYDLYPGDNVESVTVTYLSEGRELKTMDITSQALKNETITLENGLDIGDDLTFRVEIVTKNGYRYVEQHLMIFQAKEYPEDYEYERIYDMDGNLLWENDKL